MVGKLQGKIQCLQIHMFKWGNLLLKHLDRQHGLNVVHARERTKWSVIAKLFLHEWTSGSYTICPRLFTCVYRPKETGYYCNKINIGKYNIVNLVDILTDLGKTYSSTYIKERDSLKRCVLSFFLWKIVFVNTAVMILFVPSNLWEFWHGLTLWHRNSL